MFSTAVSRRANGAVREAKRRLQCGRSIGSDDGRALLGRWHRWGRVCGQGGQRTTPDGRHCDLAVIAALGWVELIQGPIEHDGHLAVGETAILLHPPLPLSGVSMGIRKGGVVKMTVSPTAMATASFRTDSPKTREYRLRSAFIAPNIASTVTGSVACSSGGGG